MTRFTRFYQWLTATPPLFELTPPFCSLTTLDPAPLDSQPYTGNARLGFVYQYLVTQALNNSKRYDVVLDELQIQSPEGRTLGAIDLIVYDHQASQHQHWELAIKFYLLHNGRWYGPNAHDQLDKKLDRMLNHQLLMSQTAGFVEQYPQYQPLESKLLLQGRLYINPFQPETIPSHCLGYALNPSQISGYWCYASQWEQINKPLFALDKHQWAVGNGEEGEPVTLDSERFVHAQTRDGEFWFIVPDTWPN